MCDRAQINLKTDNPLIDNATVNCNKKLNEDPRTFKNIFFTGFIMVTFVTMDTYYGYFDTMVVMSTKITTDFLVTLVKKFASVPMITLATVLIKVTKVCRSLQKDDSITNFSLLRKFPDPFRCLRGRHKRDSQLCCFTLPDLDRNTAK